MDTQTEIKFKEMLFEQMTHVDMSHYLESFEYSKQNASQKAAESLLLETSGNVKLNRTSNTQ